MGSFLSKFIASPLNKHSICIGVVDTVVSNSVLFCTNPRICDGVTKGEVGNIWTIISQTTFFTKSSTKWSLPTLSSLNLGSLL